MVKHRRASVSIRIAFLAMCIVLMVSAQPASAQIVFDNASFAGSISTFDHTIGGADMRMLVVGVGREGGGDVTVTYNGTAMTRIVGAEVVVDTGAFQWTDLFWLGEDSLPGAGTYQVAISGDAAWVEINNAAGAVSLENVDQSGPEATGSNGDFDSAGFTELDADITTLTDGAWTVDLIGSGFGGSDGVQLREPTVQTARGGVDGGSNGIVMSTYEVATAGLTTIGYTISGDGQNRIALSVAAFAVGTPPIFSTKPEGGTVLIGESHTFEVALLEPVGSVTYQWKRNVGSGEEDVGGADATYVLNDLLEADSGSYWVVVDDDSGLGPFTTNPVTLTVGAAIPTAQTWGLVFVALLLLASGTRLVRRRAQRR